MNVKADHPVELSVALAGLDESSGLVRVLGKGGRERVVPIGQECLMWIKKYLGEKSHRLDGLISYSSGNGKVVIGPFTVKSLLNVQGLILP